MAEREEQVWAVYVALWTDLEAEGVEVRYFAWNEDNGGFRAERTYDDGTSTPRQLIVCRFFPPVPATTPSQWRGDGWTPFDPDIPEHPDLVRELVLMAHEAGHHRSDRAIAQSEVEGRRAMHTAARELASELRSQEQRAMLLEEETLAWEIGRQLLEERGFTGWDVFEREREVSLATYATNAGAS